MGNAAPARQRPAETIHVKVVTTSAPDNLKTNPDNNNINLTTTNTGNQVSESSVSESRVQTPDKSETSPSEESGSNKGIDKRDSQIKLEQAKWREGINFGNEAVDKLKIHFAKWDPATDDIQLVKILIQFTALYSQIGFMNSRKQRFCQREFGRELLKSGTVDLVAKISLRIMEIGKRGNDLSKIQTSTLDEALVILVNLTDECVEVSEKVCQTAELLESLAECIVCRDMETWECAQDVIGVIYNCSRRPSNKDRMRSVGLVWMLRRLLQIEDNIKLFLVSVTLAGILTDEESKLFQTDDRAIRVTLELFRQSLSSAGHRFNGLSAIEMAGATSRLGISDTSKKVLLDVGFLKPLEELCATGDVEEQREALSAIWTLAFHSDVREKLMTLELLVDLIIALKDSVDEMVKTKAANILWTLRNNLKSSDVSRFKELGESMSRKSSKQKPLKDTGRHIMISYQWLVKKEMVFRLHESLEARGYRVWIDRQEMKGSMPEAMGRAVEEADIFLMCISQNYKESDNCRAEAEYAFARKTPIIPILMDSKYVADGWLGLLKGSKKHYNFSEEDFFDIIFEDLLKELGDRGKGSKTKQPAVVIPGSVSQSGHGGTAASDIPNWTPARVKQWLVESGCDSKSLQQNLTGKQIVFLKKMKKEAPEYFYNFVETKLKISDIGVLTAFVDALALVH